MSAEIITFSAARPYRAPPRPRRRDELRARAEALVAEFSGKLPSGDAGLIAAESRDDALVAGFPALSREFHADVALEDILIETVGRAEDRYWCFIRDTEPETLAGIAVKLRWVRMRENDHDTGAGLAVTQCLDALAREIADLPPR